METLADKGNGAYAYIDSLSEARKVLVEQMNGTLVTIAKDVKVQVEFNPTAVRSYRLLGYENRLLAKEDFNDDRKDAGEIGAGHSLTALYEIVPMNLPPDQAPAPLVDSLKYQKALANPPPLTATNPSITSDELMTLKLRYKAPDGDVSQKIEQPVRDAGRSFEGASAEFRFTAAVAAFGMRLRGSTHTGSFSWDGVRQLALAASSLDLHGHRSEFLRLIDRASSLTK
jgi:hypothetical protein